MQDILIKTFFEKKRWIDAINSSMEKGIDTSCLRKLSTPDERLRIYRDIRDQKYKISPPHEAQIPKDDGTYRTVYVNTDIDRVLLSIFNDMMFDLCPELIHANCKSYQKGIGCGKIVQMVSKKIQNTDRIKIGVKVDLSKYFDSVPIKYIDNIFDYIEKKFGQSNLLNIVKEYYHTDIVINMEKQPIKKYSSLRQGCAFAAFLADAVLYDIDEKISRLDVCYVRYSDDILIIGNDWEKGYKILKQMLAEKTLILNPKKVEILEKDKWFKFLGFNIKNNQISLSKARVKTFEKEIKDRTINSNNDTPDINEIIKNVNIYLYKGDGDYSWATNVLPIINVEKDINQLNKFVMDAIRASITKKTKIGGLGSTNNKSDYTITRGKGNNVKSNKEKIPYLHGYKTLMCMKNAIMTSKEIYDTLVRQI